MKRFENNTQLSLTEMATKILFDNFLRNCQNNNLGCVHIALDVCAVYISETMEF